ncbi:transferase [Niastella yeongjuensis]|uniref:Transferase n=1 Tax=Niastella yeongjuensis TaxID=354355 RepID=A0A1V9E581_9BACT|nr:glycosyltransferase [Niastella yeongjuensis]OQP41075.1 transferase [Niastella yeongjuensis]SEO92967.1 Glycosyl transferases group 1 [Niastella yeongjuensis]
MISRSHQPDRLKIFTWHIHGSYLYYLSQCNFDIYIPVNDKKNEGYYGRGKTFLFGDNVIEVPVSHVKALDFDCILFQSEKNFRIDQYEILSAEQRKLPAVYLEHNAPSPYAVDSSHPLYDPRVVLVHVTHYNKLMWKNNVPMVRVIQHGITEASHTYTGELKKGIVVINHIKERGRTTGWDIYDRVRAEVPIDLAGIGTEQYGGLGEVLFPRLTAFTTRYRFLFNPIRHTSFGLFVCEAMMAGIPVVSLATTEYANLLTNGESAFINTDVDALIAGMKLLLNNLPLATTMGQRGHAVAQEQFNMERFIREWNEVFEFAINKKMMTV